MKYEVQFDPASERDLAELWTTTVDRAAVTEAISWLEIRLQFAPLQMGESRKSSVHRVVFRRPIGLEYEVVEDDRLVLVHGVFWLGQ